MRIRQLALAGAGLAALLAMGQPGRAVRAADVMNPAPTPADWAAIAKLPDWSGIWGPDIADQGRRVRSEPMPWTPAAAAQITRLQEEERAGRPKGLFVDCFPEGMPSWMLISHNALEFLFTPGRVTMLGESDGNRLRRVYTDGRKHPDDPDPSFHGHSVGHWEGDTLVIDTVGVLPQAIIAPTEAVGLPNNGGLHVVERMRLTGPNTLQADIVVEAPKVFTQAWKTTRLYYRHRERNYDIVEGVCQQGMYQEGTDKDGNAIYVPLPHDALGAPLPTSSQ